MPKPVLIIVEGMNGDVMRSGFFGDVREKWISFTKNGVVDLQDAFFVRTVKRERGVDGIAEARAPDFGGETLAGFEIELIKILIEVGVSGKVTPNGGVEFDWLGFLDGVGFGVSPAS